MPYRVAPAPPPKIPDGPDHIAAAQRAARRNRRLGLATTGVVGAVVIASVMVHDAHRSRQLEAFESARSDLEACLLGPEPLPPASPARGPDACALRVRQRQLTAMATPVERRIDEGMSGWPMRCSEASKRMTRQAIELEDLPRQREADRATQQLATMKALGASIDIALCAGESGARAPHLSKATGASFPALAAPLDLDALAAHGPPSIRAKSVKELEEDPQLASLLPEGRIEVGSWSKARAEDPVLSKLPDGDHLMLDLDWPGVIHLAKCDGGKCQKRIVARETFDLNDPELRPSDPERFRATRLGGSILAVWRAGTRGGLRMRLAPLDALAKTSDVVLFDDVLLLEGRTNGNTSLEGFRVYGGPRAGRIFLVTRRGTWILDVDEQGAVALR